MTEKGGKPPKRSISSSSLSLLLVLLLLLIGPSPPLEKSAMDIVESVTDETTPHTDFLDDDLLFLGTISTSSPTVKR